MEFLRRHEITAQEVLKLQTAAVNPITKEERPSNYNEEITKRHALPVFKSVEEILRTYEREPVMVISGETGSGKSTQVPQLLTLSEWDSGLKVACTQPRRLACSELARRVAHEMGVDLGNEVGYRHGGHVLVGDQTRLVYMTEGVLKLELMADNNLSTHACVVIDEAQERTTDTDVLLALLKGVVHRRQGDFKLVIMSATLDAPTFQAYYDSCPMVQIKGRQFPVEIQYCPENQIGTSFIVAAVNHAITIHVDSIGEEGDILVFLPGKSEIERFVELITPIQAANDMDIFPLHAEMSRASQYEAIDRFCRNGNNRKCIVATNVAETSLTIDGVRFVIDSGLSKQKIFCPRLRLQMLELRPISQASAKQRAGRAGRTSAGTCIRLYSKKSYDKMAPFTETAIRCQSLDGALLILAFFKVQNFADFNWITPPEPELILRSIQDLKHWDFLDASCKITPAGQVAVKYPLEPMWCRAIHISSRPEFQCTKEIIKIAVVCSISKDIFLRASGFHHVDDTARSAFKHPLSDHLTILNAFNAYLIVRHKFKDAEGYGHYAIKRWCYEHALNARALQEANQLRSKVEWVYTRNMRVNKIPFADPNDLTKVRKALAVALFTHTAIHKRRDGYATVHENADGILAPDSSLVENGYEWIVATEFSRSPGGKQILYPATVIDIKWLVDLPYFKDENLPQKRGYGGFRQQKVKDSLDRARGAMSAPTCTSSKPYRAPGPEPTQTRPQTPTGASTHGSEAVTQAPMQSPASSVSADNTPAGLPTVTEVSHTLLGTLSAFSSANQSALVDIPAEVNRFLEDPTAFIVQAALHPASRTAAVSPAPSASSSPPRAGTSSPAPAPASAPTTSDAPEEEEWLIDLRD